MADEKDLLHHRQPGGAAHLLRLRGHAELIARGRAEAYSLALQAVPWCLASVKLNGKWGFIDKTGKFIIQPAFESVGDFSEGLARAKIAGRHGFGYIDKCGKIVVEPRFVEACQFIDGYAMVSIYNDEQDECEWGYLRRDSLAYVREGWWSDGFYESIVALKEECEVHEGLRPVCAGWDYGYQDERGRWVIEPQFGMAGHFSEGLAPVRIGDLWGVIDKQVNFVVKPQYEMIYEFSEGLAAFRLEGKYGFIDNTGRRAIDASFDEYGWQFDKGRAGVGISGLYGIIDKFGKFSVSPCFRKIGFFCEGLARVQSTNERWGFIDRQAQIAIDPKFDDVGSFHLIE